MMNHLVCRSYLAHSLCNYKISVKFMEKHIVFYYFINLDTFFSSLELKLLKENFKYFLYIIITLLSRRFYTFYVPEALKIFL